MDEPPRAPAAPSEPAIRRADGLSPRTTKALVIAMVVGMIGLILAISMLSPKQVRFPLDPDAPWDEALIVDRSADALRTLGHTPLSVVRPNPDAPDGDDAAVADDPANPVYQTVYWTVAEGGESDGAIGTPRRWRVAVKQLDNEFIAWPNRAE
ncbi:MAG: hypothetical protein AAFY08_16235 [Planctomycetota bacterium]